MSGHVDTVGKVLRSLRLINHMFLNLKFPKKERKHLIEKASISVNGISLTISKVTKKGFQIWIIPHTYKETNLSKLKKSSLSKY
jgi:riboflavin synthase